MCLLTERRSVRDGPEVFFSQAAELRFLFRCFRERKDEEGGEDERGVLRVVFFSNWSGKEKKRNKSKTEQRERRREGAHCK